MYITTLLPFCQVFILQKTIVSVPMLTQLLRKNQLTFRWKASIIIGLNDASVAQSVVHLTRNEKVACSSQVTSSS